MKTYVDSFLELIYPEKNICFICETYDESIGSSYICPSCWKKAKKLLPPLCSKCSKPIDYVSSINLCPECNTHKRYFELSKSPFLYEGEIKKAIYKYKYYNKHYYYKFFGNILINFMKENNYLNFDYIVSVPLHSSKMRIRGYNQSELIAKYLSKELNIPYFDALKRTRKTIKQSTQSKEERRKNLENAFSIKNSPIELIHKTVLLVDDIYTTGSTVNECSKVLINYGIKKVYVITIAR